MEFSEGKKNHAKGSCNVCVLLVAGSTGRGASLVIKLPDKAFRLPVFKINRQLHRVRKTFTVSLK